MHYLRRLVVILLAVGLLVSIPGLNPVRAQKAEEPPFRLPFLDPPGASTWLLGQAYSALTLDESGVQAANAVELARGGRLRPGPGAYRSSRYALQGRQRRLVHLAGWGPGGIHFGSRPQYLGARPARCPVIPYLVFDIKFPSRCGIRGNARRLPAFAPTSGSAPG